MPGAAYAARVASGVGGVGGDGWVACRCGSRHWGRFGAAGLAVAAEGRVLLQHRAAWSHEGDRWGFPGGARHRDEPAVDAALREAAEEAALDGAAVEPTAELVLDHGDWAYATVVATAAAVAPVRPADAESAALRWVPLPEVGALDLHSGVAAAWPLVADLLGRRIHLVVDAANVVGSRPDGWWKDRAGATARLRARLRRLALDGVPADAVAGRSAADAGADPPAASRSPAVPALRRWFPAVTLVVEGRAREVPDGDAPVRTVRADGSGDDAIVAAVAAAVAGVAAAGGAGGGTGAGGVMGAAAPPGGVLTVTADRELADRCRAAGGTVRGPGWLHALLPPPP